MQASTKRKRETVGTSSSEPTSTLQEAPTTKTKLSRHARFNRNKRLKREAAELEREAKLKREEEFKQETEPEQKAELNQEAEPEQEAELKQETELKRKEVLKGGEEQNTILPQITNDHTLSMQTKDLVIEALICKAKSDGNKPPELSEIPAHFLPLLDNAIPKKRDQDELSIIDEKDKKTDQDDELSIIDEKDKKTDQDDELSNIDKKDKSNELSRIKKKDKRLWIAFGRWLGFKQPITRKVVRHYLRNLWKKRRHAAEMRSKVSPKKTQTDLQSCDDVSVPSIL